MDAPQKLNVGQCLDYQRSVSLHDPSADTVVETVSVIDDGQKIEVVWNNNTSRFHAVWLRHHCQCGECLSADIKQVLIEIDRLPLDIKVKDVTQTENGGVRIQWDDSNHTGEFSSAFLRTYCYSQNSLQQKKAAIRTSLYTGVWWLKNLNEYGLTVIKGAPITDLLLTEFLPKHVAPLIDRSYGKIVDVMYTPNATNLAFTRNKLQFHMDMVYYESVPGIMFLHCLKFDESIIGGETIFVDMFAVCEEFRKTNPAEFKTLCSIPCPFSRDHFSRDKPVHLMINRPIINLNNDGEIIGVYWNPSTVGVLEIPEDDVTDYYRAYQLFARAISNFHTKGCGIDISDYRSRLIHLSRMYGGGSSIKRVCNMDWR